MWLSNTTDRNGARPPDSLAILTDAVLVDLLASVQVLQRMEVRTSAVWLGGGTYVVLVRRLLQVHVRGLEGEVEKQRLGLVVPRDYGRGFAGVLQSITSRVE